ncbi:Alpha/Beta hydrolase protein [Xylariaceae sp. FL0255]|nr:Alpha/Beta hydrolase protein [Xylariaceae sp. FL0255]
MSGNEDDGISKTKPTDPPHAIRTSTTTTTGNLPPSKKKPRKAKDKTGTPPSRAYLRAEAVWWRHLQCIGMGLHWLAPPRPPNTDFTRSIPSTIAQAPGEFLLHFYVPAGYQSSRASSSTSVVSDKSDNSKRWPVVVNFHGGGFTLGKATDDARFARFVMEQSEAVLVSVDYRLAPEHPFPTAVDDGVDALLYLINHADELHIDPNRLATSGFSAGGNIALTAPMRLASLKQPVPKHKVVAVATWYPITDYTLSREERRADSVRPDATIPPALTNLFDASYLFPPELDLADPYLSPNKATDEQLRDGIPENVFFFTCEWDMLLREGEFLARRLQQPPVSKRIFYTMVRGVPHGWDKSPNPLKPPHKSEKFYRECCNRLNKVFRGDDPRSVFERPRRVPPPPSPPPKK